MRFDWEYGSSSLGRGCRHLKQTQKGSIWAMSLVDDVKMCMEINIRGRGVMSAVHNVMTKKKIHKMSIKYILLTKGPNCYLY